MAAEGHLTVDYILPVLRALCQIATTLVCCWLRRGFHKRGQAMDSVASKPFMTVTEAGARLGVPGWVVRRLFERKLLPEPQRAGERRIIIEEDLPVLEKALRQHGYLAK
jgi:hypothetical protein